MGFKLYEIVSILKAAFMNLDLINDKDLVILLGNTGCGKSTMLNSILLGPDTLHETQIKKEIIVRNKVKIKSQTVIA